jgi:hypothetical protein
MNDQVKASAKLAREFLQMVTEGIGKQEGGAGEFARAGASHLARRLPAKWSSGSRHSGSTIALLLAAGVVASTAVLIYSRTRGGKAAAAKRRRSRR